MQISDLATGSMPLIRTPPPASPVPRGRFPVRPPGEPVASPATKPEDVAAEMVDAATTPIPAGGLGEPAPAGARDRKTKRLVVTGIAAASVLFAVAASAFLLLGGDDLIGDGTATIATDLGGQQGQPAEGGQGPEAEPVASAGLDTGRTQAPTERDQQPPAARPAPPPRGRLRIAGVPPGARASVDGSRVTNLQNLTLRTGQHTIVVEADGYRTLQGAITITSGRLSTFDASGMQRIPVPQPDLEAQVERAPPVAQVVSHPLCAISPPDAAAIAGTASAAMVLTNCVPGITVRLRGRPLNTAALPTNQRLRIVIAASGYQTLRVDTTLSPGTVLVLSGALVSRN